MALPSWVGVAAAKLLNKTQFVIRIAHGTRVGVKRPTAYGWSGELTMTTDTANPHLYAPQITGQPFQPIQTLDMAICFDNQVVCFNNEIVYQD